MKIRKIIDICKKNGNIIIFESGKEQWISDGAVETDVERLCNIKPLCARCHRAEHEKERSDTEGKK